MNVQDSSGLRDVAAAVRQNPLNVLPLNTREGRGFGVVRRLGSIERRNNLIGVRGLRQIAGGTELHALDGGGNASVPGQDDHHSR